MARIRTIKPEMAQDEDLASVSIEAQLLAVRILNHADDEGYFKANPALIKANCFPLMDSLNIHGMLTELSEIGYLSITQGTDGKQYGKITNFSKHQKINRPSDSKIKDLVTFTERSVSHHGTLTIGKEQGTGKGKDKTPLSTPLALTAEDDSEPDKIPPCPHLEIIAAYHETLPELPRVVESLWPNSTDAANLQARWRSHPEHQDLDFWRGFFEVVRTNPHWMGENDRGWKANLRWLVNKTNFTKVAERWANAA